MDWNELFGKVKVDSAEVKTMKNTYDCYIRLIKDQLKRKDGNKSKVKDTFVDTSNGIATIRNRSFRIEERKIIANNCWNNVKTKLLAIYQAPDEEKLSKYHELKDYIKSDIKIGNSMPHAATLRLAASVLPDYLCSIAAEADMNNLLIYLEKKGLIIQADGDWRELSDFGKSHFLRKKIEKEYNAYSDKVADTSLFPICCCLLPWRIYDYFKGEDVCEIEDMLYDNHNVILTGAPGTGKTFLAKKVASLK